MQEDQFEKEQEPNVVHLPIDADSDDSLARDFAARHPHLRYVDTRGKWYRWDGKRWGVDSTGHTFHEIRLLLRSAEPSKEKSSASLRSAQRVAAVEKLSRYDPKLAATIHQWDADDWQLNTPDGVVDLRTGHVSAHRMDGYHTKMTGPGPSGTCPRWDRFLLEVTNSDLELVQFLQRVAGYALTGVIREHALFFFYGTGANGKGTFLNTLTGVFADYATTASMDTFTQSNSDRHPTDLAGLQGARLVVAQETEEGRRWAENRIKMMTGGDPVRARFMRQDEFTYHPKFKLLIAGNHKPRLRNVDEAIRRRLHLVPFTVTVPPARRDTELDTKLKAEWPGILHWCVDGCLAYLKEGLNPPKAVLDATAEYFSGQDLFSQWIEDHCEVAPEHWESPSRMFAAWRQYAEKHNESVGTQSTFCERMEAMGFTQTRNRSRGRHWLGIQLAPVEVQEAVY